ncbi:DBP2 [Symbiodinium sp. CCMP2456]|nr:DBP2 [Symbiodinium sp. CCMP2456]
MSWDNYKGGRQDDRWGQESWQDSGTGWGQDSWQEDSRGSGWQASRHEEPLDPWASYLANKNKVEEADPWSSQGNHRGGHRQEDRHGSNDRGGRQDSWGGSRGRRSQNEDDSWNHRQQDKDQESFSCLISGSSAMQDDSWNHRQQDNSWNNQRQRQDDHSRQSWGQDSWQQSKWDGDSQDNRRGGRGQVTDERFVSQAQLEVTSFVATDVSGMRPSNVIKVVEGFVGSELGRGCLTNGAPDDKKRTCANLTYRDGDTHKTDDVNVKSCIDTVSAIDDALLLLTFVEELPSLAPWSAPYCSEAFQTEYGRHIRDERGGWSDWERPPRNQDSGNDNSWNHDNRHDDQQAWGQNSWDQDATDPWANWNSSGGRQEDSSGWGASGSKDKDWDGVNQWATQLLEQGDVDWTTRPEIAITKDFYEEMGDEKAKSRTKQEIEELRAESGIAILEGDSDDCPAPGPFSSFDEVHWPAELQQSLVEEFEAPTPIQKQIWPLALQGRDVVGIAETGSGKTVSYVLPMIIHISRQEELDAGDGPVGLVLAPTRELAKQIERVCKKYGSLKHLASATIVGGMKTSEHKELLQARNDIIVATPGRFLQALGDEWTKLNRCTFVVLDEADELLEHKGFGGDIRAIMTQVRKERQVLMFSATWPEVVKELAQEICTASDGRPPVHIHIGGTRLAACKSIVQRAEIVDDDEAKFTKLKEKLHEMQVLQEGSTDKCIIFCRSRNGVIKLKDQLSNEDMVWNGTSNCLVQELHGELQQSDRDWAMEQFRDGPLPCVVATGVLARGHDIPQVRFVINYDMPRVAEDYIHRVGRTGRAGHTGYAFTFVNRSNWQELQWAHDYLLGVLQATEQNVDETLQEAIDAHLKARQAMLFFL